MPGDWGPVGANKAKLKEIVTRRASGRVLEAMCGFNSYFGESVGIREVVALDFCREALERYEYPQRVRILYDLERVANGEKLDFFGDSSFQTVGVFFAVGYLTDPVPVHKEFHRLLAEDGRLLVVGGTAQGYTDILKRRFKPKECAKAMHEAGFTTKTKKLPLKTSTELGEYYLVEGTKTA
jgi:ubiquinone/menaquinone biosynthesis C-methylase UbiE